MTDGPDLRARLDHVGIAVNDRGTMAPVLELLGGELIADEAGPGYRWVLYELGDLSRIELLEPTEDDTFLTEFLDRHGSGLHHITLEVADIDAVVEHLDANAVAVVDRRDRHQYKEAFIPPRAADGVLVQLMEFEPRFDDEYGVPGKDALVDRSYLS